jgi:hypothetical protein
MRVLHSLCLAECKNWSDPVDSKAIDDFSAKLLDRNIKNRLLIATNSITGDPQLEIIGPRIYLTRLVAHCQADPERCGRCAGVELKRHVETGVENGNGVSVVLG